MNDNNTGSYVLMTDSSCDLTEEMTRELDVSVLPLIVNVSGREYKNYPFEKELGTKRFYDLLRSGQMASTSAANADMFIKMWTPMLDKGNDVLYIGFSSALSATFQNSCIAAEEISEKYPDRKICCIDSRCASMGQGLLVYLAANKKRQGASITELKAYIEETYPKLCHWFTVDDLHFLKRGGRISATTATVGSILHIKPVLHVDDEGRLTNVDKVRGRKASIRALADKAEEEARNIQSQTIMISHGDCMEDAQTLAEMINASLHPVKIIINNIGPVIGAHSGPGTLALFFLGAKR
jgi:DegV family protein with EDD domain